MTDREKIANAIDNILRKIQEVINLHQFHAVVSELKELEYSFTKLKLELRYIDENYLTQLCRDLINWIDNITPDLNAQEIKLLQSCVGAALNVIDENRIKVITRIILSEHQNKIDSMNSQLDDVQKLLDVKKFDVDTKTFSSTFNATKKNLIIEKYIYLFIAIIFTLVLGCLYIKNSWDDIKIGSFDYKNHLGLMAISSPFIFLTIWMFYQVGHFNRLIDIYTHKANLAFTLFDSINFSLHNDSKKECTLKILYTLLDRLYASPIKFNKSNIDMSKHLSRLTRFVHELRNFVHESSK